MDLRLAAGLLALLLLTVTPPPRGKTGVRPPSFPPTKLPPGAKPAVARWAQLVADAIARYPAPGLTLALMLGQIETESGGNPKATSRVPREKKPPYGAMGLMQLMPDTAIQYGLYQYPGDFQEGYVPEKNIDGGVHLMSDNLRLYNGNVEKALVAYYAGRGTAKRWPNLSASILAYPAKVMARAKKYEGL